MFFISMKMARDLGSVRSVSMAASYESAVWALNNLQSNATYIQAVARHNSSSNTNLQDTRKYLFRSGVTSEQLDTISVIHVAGTKGKGSTCAFTESILRNHGFRTGFYSSPHLVSVRERFRINGQPINERDFTRHFWKVYDRLDDLKEHDSDMPLYFKFLTIMMFHVFLESNIDVAIIEVGIGGEHDCTNIIGHPVCAGITSLGLDHTSLLGNTLESIAYQKSGIFKEYTHAFTVPQQEVASNILKQRAAERNCELTIVPDIACYDWIGGGAPVLGIGSGVQGSNASLAVQLAHTWMARRIINQESSEEILSNTNLCSFHISLEKTAIALSACTWPGRFQVLRGRAIDFHIDGAHTVDSIEVCASWFEDRVKNSAGMRFLIFNTTGDRDSVSLLAPLRRLNFDKVYFVPNVAGTISKMDQFNISVTTEEQVNRCHWHSDIWGDGSVVLNSVSEALIHIYADNNLNTEVSCERPQLLITGSLHLVGAALAYLDPHLTMTTHY